MITSSAISSAPVPLQIVRSPSRNPGAAGTTPMLPATGSTITHARSSPCVSASARAASQVVVLRDQRVRRHRRRHARASPGSRAWPGPTRPAPAARRRARGSRPRTSAPSPRPVNSARQPQGAHRRLGARRHEPHHLDRGHRLHHLGRQLHLQRRRHPEGRAPRRRPRRPPPPPPGARGPRSAAPRTAPSRRSGCRRHRSARRPRRRPRTADARAPPTASPAPGSTPRPGSGGRPPGTAAGTRPRSAALLGEPTGGP